MTTFRTQTDSLIQKVRYFLSGSLFQPLFLSAKFRTKSSLQFRDYLLVWNCLSRLVLLNDLWFLVYQLQNKGITKIILIQGLKPLS